MSEEVNVGVVNEETTKEEDTKEVAQTETPQEASESTKSVDVHTQEELDSMTPEEKIGVLKDYTEIIDLAAKQSTTNREIQNVWKQKEAMGDYMKKTEEMKDPMEVINAKLATVPNADVLMHEYLPYPEKVAWFFEDDDTGDVIEFNFPKNSEISKDLFSFQKDLLLFFKRCDDAVEEYNQISKDAEEELKAINADIEEINRIMGDNVLAFVDALKDSVKEGSPDYKQSMEICRGIESAYNFSMVFETLEKYPSVVRNTLEDFKRESRITNIGERYGNVVKKSNTSVNLITFLPRSKDVKTIEQLALSKFYRPGTDDLFIFILIRWFAMNGMDDIASKKFHAALYHVLYQLTSNQISDAVYDMVLENMKKLLTVFYDQMPSPIE
ncbi:MAG: hypothetical protein NC548_27790 [Lachnospiraceae bacterium]|nr:hypothetical protein [Lachnospiraceae bacterium]